MIASEGLAIDQLDTRSDGRAVIEPDAPDLAAALRGARVPRQAQARAGPAAGEQIRTILSDLGLDVPAPAFARSIGRSRHACVPVPNRPPGRSWSPRMPVLSILIDASSMAEPELDQIAQGLAAQIYPFWELCVAGSGRAIDRSVLAADPRLRLVAGRADTAAAAITRAASVATGTHVIVARSAAEASAVSGSLAALAACLEQNAEVAVLLAAETSGAGDFADRIEAGGPGVRPVAFRRDAFVAAGGLRRQDGAAAEYRLLLAILAARRPIGRCLPADAPVRDADGPAAEEAGRLALQAHLTATRGPLAYVEQGLRPFTYRRRTHLMHRSVPAVIRVSPGGLPAWTQADLASEHLVFIENGVVPAAHAIAALLELLAEEEISTAGGRVRRREGTLHHAGLHVTPDGRLRWPGRGRPDDPGRGEAELYVVHNPPAVGGGVLATRRSVLLQLGGFDRALGDLEGATFDLLAADYCLRCGADFGLRTTYTPFAMFERIDDRPAWRTRTPAETLFAARWRVKPGRS